MARCKVCKTNIPDGKEYCNNCQDKDPLKSKSNESYLDSLLNSVKNANRSSDSVNTKNDSSSSGVKAELVNDSNAKFLEEVEASDFLDDPAYSIDLDDINEYNLYMDQLEEDYIRDEVEDNLFNSVIEDEIGEEELYGDSLTNLLSFDSKTLKTQEAYDQSIQEDKALATMQSEEQENTKIEESNHFNSNLDSEVAATLEWNPVDLGEEEQMKNEEQFDYRFEEDDNQLTPYDMSEFEEDEFDPDLNELLSSLEHMEENTTDDEINRYNDDSFELNNTEDNDQFGEEETEDEDFLALLNQISSDDPVAEDVKAINSLLNGEPVESFAKDVPSDVGEVFSDALKVVTALNDNEINEAELLQEKAISKEKKKKKKSKKQKVVKEPEDTPKISLWKRLFGNIKDENSKKEETKKGKGEAAAEPKKAAKKAKAPKGAKGIAATTEDNDNTTDSKLVKKTAAKKEKKEKVKKQKEITRVIDEIDEDEGRINRVGAFIVFLFFALLALLIFVGTNMVSYTLSIQNATKYFDNNKYTEAYNEVYGIEIRDEDIELYDKIMTVMFVNKQLNSYNNYYTIGKYPEALDSLLKGLKRYDKYIELATLLGIESDMNYVRDQILAELELVFHISEKEAMKINSYENMSDYSLKVYDVALENRNN